MRAREREAVLEILRGMKGWTAVGERRGDPFRVLISTILSQRTRDENTERASAALFSVYSTPEAIAGAPAARLEKLIRPSGFYHVKARTIKEVSRIVVQCYGGAVPEEMDALLKLPGVGRKTANCVLVYGFGRSAIPVDTHVHRVSNRLGLVETKRPEETEEALRRIIPRRYWLDLNEVFVRFGREVCRPVGPRHEICPLRPYCAHYKAKGERAR